MSTHAASLVDGTTAAPASAWRLDPAHTQAGFEVTHMMFAKVRGRFGQVEGTLFLDPEGDLRDSRVEVSIATASIDTNQPQRDAHLRSADFFDAERFPELRFRSLAVAPKGPDVFKLVGELTIRDVTRVVELDVVRVGRGLDPDGFERIAFSATTTLDRRDFGLTWNVALETGGILVGNEVRIVLEVQAVPADA